MYYNPAKPQEAILERTLMLNYAVWMLLDAIVCSLIWVLALHGKA